MSLTLFLPCLQQLDDGFLHPLGRITFREFVRLVIFAPEWMEKATGKKADFSEETKEERAKMGMVFGLEPPKTDLLAVVKEAEEIRIFASQTEVEAEYELL